MTTDESSQQSPIVTSLREYSRGVAGGLIISLPLLLTAEVWRTGAVISPDRLLWGALGGFALLVVYNRYAGLRQDATWLEVLIDSVEELGIGLLLSAMLLWMLGQLDGEMPLRVLLNTVLLEGLLTAIGVSVGTAQLGGSSEDTGTSGDDSATSMRGILALQICGAVLVAANVAPTDEISIVASRSQGIRLLLIALLALLLSGIIVFYSDFVHSQSRTDTGLLGRIGETCQGYAVALLCSAALLWFFGRFDGQNAAVMLSRSVVLSLPAALGASAGRLLIKGGGS